MSIETEPIRITVNGDARQFMAGRSVSDLLAALGLHPRLVVVEHNRQILDHSRFDAVQVQAGDVFELVHFVGGG